jgi:hypothetical protein
MTKQMSFRNMVAVQPVKDPAAPKATPKRQPRHYVNTLEYELITSLVMQQYTNKGEVRFDQLLAMPQEDRIATLMQEFGVKRMHHMILMMVKAFCYTLKLPKIKKLSDTKMSGVACDFMVAAQEDNLALEDIILFFERAKGGKYGPIKSMAYHYQMMQLFEQYRKERRSAQQQTTPEQDMQLKAIKKEDRIAPQPTAIGDLLQGALVIDMSKKMSG